MLHMLVRHRVAEFERWKRVFDAHAVAQRQAGLRVTHVMRDTAEGSDVVLLFEVEDFDRARAFVTSPAVPDAQEESGVLDEPEILFLRSV